jgi:hypothetical protein
MRNRALKRLEAKLNKKPFIPAPKVTLRERTDPITGDVLKDKNGNTMYMEVGAARDGVYAQLVQHRQRISPAELAAMRAAEAKEVPPGVESQPCPGEDNRDCGKPAPPESIGVNDGE